MLLKLIELLPEPPLFLAASVASASSIYATSFLVSELAAKVLDSPSWEDLLTVSTPLSNECVQVKLVFDPPCADAESLLFKVVAEVVASWSSGSSKYEKDKKSLSVIWAVNFAKPKSDEVVEVLKTVPASKSDTSISVSLVCIDAKNHNLSWIIGPPKVIAVSNLLYVLLGKLSLSATRLSFWK